MIHMKITFYKNLKDALETLKENEYLYSHSWLNTLKIRYKNKKRSNEYEPVSVVRSSPFKYGRYEHFIFRKDVIEDLVRGTISAVENNSDVFKSPLRESITLGLKEFYSRMEDKDFVCVGNAELRYPRGYAIGKSKNLNEPILMSMREEEWKKSFMNLGTIKKIVEKGITERIMKMKGIKNGGDYYVWSEYDWADIIIVADKELVDGKGRALARFWESDRVLGVDKIVNTLLSDWELESESELKSLLKDNIEKFGQEYAKKNFSKMVLGGICLYLSDLPRPKEMEVVMVPINITSENKKGDKEVEFLVLAKLKIGDRIFSWMPVSVNYDAYKSGSSDAIQRSGTKNLIRLVNQEEMPVEMSKNKGKAIFINTALTEQVFLFPLRKQNSETEIVVDKIRYTAEMEDSKFVKVSLEDEEDLSVKEYKEIEKTKIVNEKMVIEVKLGGEMKNLGCKEIVYEPMKKQIEDLAKNLYEQEIEEKDPETRNGIRLANIVLKRLLRAMGEEKISKRRCIPTGRDIYRDDYNTYQHSIYPEAALEGEGPLTKAVKDFPVPEIVKRAKKTIELLEVEREKKSCFKVDGLEKKIDVIEDIEEILKEPLILYVKSLSGALSRMLENHISNVKGVLGELEEINRLSVALSGAVASAIGKFPNPNDTAKINEMTKEIYKLLFRSIVGGEVESYDYGENFGWRRKSDTLLKWRALIRDMVGIRLIVNVIETINVEVREERVTVRRWVTTSTRKDYGEDLWAVYLDSGYSGKLIEMTVVR
jgi:hypothetical protein